MYYNKKIIEKAIQDKNNLSSNDYPALSLSSLNLSTQESRT
jgi:hypothetical protein